MTAERVNSDQQEAEEEEVRRKHPLELLCQEILEQDLLLWLQLQQLERETHERRRCLAVRNAAYCLQFDSLVDQRLSCKTSAGTPPRRAVAADQLTVQCEACFFPVQRIVYPRSDDFLYQELDMGVSGGRSSCVSGFDRLTCGFPPWTDSAPRTVELAMVNTAARRLGQSALL